MDLGDPQRGTLKLSGYVDREAGAVYCRQCGDDGDGMWMEQIYNPDVSEDTPPCFSCGAKLEQ